MGSVADTTDQRATPKLSFYSLPTKTPEPAGMLTPPLRPPASVPFLWEEAPGKPRTCSYDSKPATARSLELPPRLLCEMKIANLPSPTTVLDGPYVVRSASCSSYRDVGQRSMRASSSPDREKWQLGSASGLHQKKDKERLVGFWRKKGRRGNGRLDGGSAAAVASINGRDDGDLGFGFSSSCSSSSSVSDVGNRSRGDEAQVKITRFRRKGSLLNVSNTSAHFWASICGSLRHVAPWRARKLKNEGLP